MHRKLFYLISIISLLSMTGNASGDLILHWGFDEGSGTTAFDSSGNGHDGTIEGNVTWTVGKIGGALEFDGSDCHVVDEAAGDYINGLDAITICLWIKSDIVGTDKGFVIFEDPNGGDNRNMRYDAASWAWVNVTSRPDRSRSRFSSSSHSPNLMSNCRACRTSDMPAFESSSFPSLNSGASFP